MINSLVLAVVSKVKWTNQSNQGGLFVNHCKENPFSHGLFRERASSVSCQRPDK
jgi:hypothetical protein